MFYNLYRRWNKRTKVQETPETVETEEVKIPVGGITDSGVVYEKKVYPDGKELLYKEVRIDDSKKDESGKNETN